MSLKEISNNDEPGFCPRCNRLLEYGSTRNIGDSYSYECWCTWKGCDWRGYEVYDLLFNCFMENDNEEVRNERRTDNRSKSYPQWDSKGN